MTKRDPAATIALPFRVEKRPDPNQWLDDELMTLEEAAYLFWPDGPLTPNSLRTAVRDGLLDVAAIAGKLLTTKASLKRMSVCRSHARHVPSESQDLDAGCPGSVAEMQRRFLDRHRDDV